MKKIARYRKDYIEAPYEYQYIRIEKGKMHKFTVPVPERFDENMNPIEPFEEIAIKPTPTKP